MIASKQEAAPVGGELTPGPELAALAPAERFTPEALASLSGPARDQAIAQLHQTHGNAAVNDLLDAQSPAGEQPAGAGGATAEQAVTLSPAAIADARGYHRLQPTRYPPKVMIEIQRALGVGESGVADDATVLAIAAFQARINRERQPTPPLQVDGKAGPRTLPILIPQGLATEAQLDAYTSDVKGKHAELAKETPAQRATELLALINARLAAVGVPPCTLGKESGGDASQFHAGDWTIDMSARELADPDGAAATIYHEARHAEQAFRIARMLAGRGKNAAQIAAELGLEKTEIADAAVKVPFAPGTVEATEAAGWHDPEIGHQPSKQVYAALGDTALDLTLAIADDLEQPSPAHHAAALASFARQSKAYLAYRDLPNEYDGFFLGDKVADGLGHARSPTPTFDDMVAQVKKMPPDKIAELRTMRRGH